jgi:outer membrane protein assembly factor BamB
MGFCDVMTTNSNRLQLSFAALAASILTAAPAWAADWGTPGFDGAHARLTSERSGALFTNGRWSAGPVGSTKVLASPVVADGFVVTADVDGIVRARHADTGALAWQVTLKMAVHGTPAVLKGRVYVPTLENKLVALRLLDGTPLWSQPLDGMVMSSPVAIDGDIVLAAGFPQRHVERLSSETGKQIWRSPPVIDQFSNTSPAVGGGLVVVGSAGGRYYALDALTGLLKWEYIADGTVNLAAPLIVGTHVYMAGGGPSSMVHAVDLATGAALPGWPVSLPAPEPDIAGTRMSRGRAISSFAAAGGLVMLQTRLDDVMDTNADSVADKYLLREIVVGLDASTGARVWQHALARAERTDPNHVPSFLTCPTPAAYASDNGAPLLAAASSLDAAIKVLDVAAGGELARHLVAGPALASPVVANAMLITTAFDGTTQALFSSANHAPAAPIAAESARPLDAAQAPTLRWLPATDADAEQASYELRIDTDGELLETWQHQIFLAAGVTSTTLAAALTPGVTYSYALRARDGRGALSPWSRTSTFILVVNPPVTVNGASGGNLAGALAGAQPGDVIGLGEGIYTLTQAMTVRGGVSIQGAGAGRTILDAAGLATGINFEGKGSAHLDRVTIHGADTCVNVADGATDARLTHVIVRDCKTNGVMVRAGGVAELVNTTVVSNPTGVTSSGTTRIKNSVLTKNGVALTAAGSGTLVSAYDNLIGNTTDYHGVGAGTGDLSVQVTFVDFAGKNLKFGAPQPSTDRGDPTDDVGAEPMPHGGRINLGAFGGTADAETSELSTIVGGSLPRGTPQADVTPPGQVTPPASQHDDDAGCSIGGRGTAGWSVTILLLGLLLRRRRTQR